LAYVRLQGKREDIVHMDAVQIERDTALDFWADVVRTLATQGVRRVIVAANNHYQGYSPGTVAALQRRLALPVGVPPAQQSGSLAQGGPAPRARPGARADAGLGNQYEGHRPGEWGRANGTASLLLGARVRVVINSLRHGRWQRDARQRGRRGADRERMDGR